MSTQFSFTSSQLFFALVAIFLIIVAVILFGRVLLKKTSARALTEKPKFNSSHNRTKYASVDVERFSGTFRILGLALVLAALLFMVNWTTYDRTIDIPENALELEEEITVEPPRTKTPPPPPPPPPPPVIEEVPDEMILEEDEDIEFMDQSIEAETAVEVIEYEDKGTEKAPPPPPPPPVEEEVEEIFKVVEEMPRFPGCENMDGSTADKKTCADKKLLEFIYENVQYPTIARESNIQGQVVVSFVVNQDGSIEQIEVLRDIGAGCGEEAVRVIELMKEKGIKWIPGRQRGKPVRVQFLMPVQFKLL